MKVISSLSKIDKHSFDKNILILGIFDGVHLGHRYLIKKAVSRAKTISAKVIIFTFWPHPKQADSIMPIKERVELFKELGVSACIIKKFTKSFSNLSAKSFFELIFKRLKPKEIFVGENFHFGKNKGGDVEKLNRFCKNKRIKLNIVKLFKVNNENVSSSLVRSLIKNGNLKKSARLLGRPVYIIGRVTEGKAIGRKLGFPTANILPYHEVLPPAGVYAIEVLFKKDKFFGMAYIGTKPTFLHCHKMKEPVIEAHIFDFKNYIYGRDIKLLFLKRIRLGKKFINLIALKKQLKKDERKIRAFLSTIHRSKS